MFFTKGVGVHKEKLASFEMALRVAGLAHCNLVLVSSIYPPGCKVISKDEGLKLLKPGEIVFAVYDRESSNEPNRLMAASVGVAIPADPSMHGYLSEHHSFGETDEKAGEYAEDLAASMLATTLGIDFNSESDWDEREQIFKMSGKIVRTTNMFVVCGRSWLQSHSFGRPAIFLLGGIVSSRENVSSRTIRIRI